MILFGSIIYPILGYFLGHIYPSSSIFGLPCPTTIFTIGALLLASKQPRYYAAVIPLLWTAIGFLAAVSLGVMEDTSLLIAGLIGIGGIMFRREKIAEVKESI
nr:DUF6064 family protein [Methanosarcina horonobensis]